MVKKISAVFGILVVLIGAAMGYAKVQEKVIVNTEKIKEVSSIVREGELVNMEQSTMLIYIQKNNDRQTEILDKLIAKIK